MSAYKWNPWHGCKKISSGCQNCYVYYLDKQRGLDASVIKRNKTNFNLPERKSKDGTYKIPSGVEVDTCFTSDFFLEEADSWRSEAWEMIHKRRDLKFLIPTKRVERILKCLPNDWGLGYDNVTIAVSVEDSFSARQRLPKFLELPIQHKYIFVCPILEKIDLTDYLHPGQIELVSVGGESYEGARECDFEWVKSIYVECKQNNVPFIFHQTGSSLIVDDHTYSIPRTKEFSQAKLAMKSLQKKASSEKT